MSANDILTLIDAEIAKLQAARALMTGAPVKRKSGPPKSTAVSTVKPKKKKRNLSPEGRARIVSAVKARWAKQKKAAK
jgi:hypothetical protein